MGKKNIAQQIPQHVNSFSILPRWQIGHVPAGTLLPGIITVVVWTEVGWGGITPKPGCGKCVACEWL